MKREQKISSFYLPITFYDSYSVHVRKENDFSFSEINDSHRVCGQYRFFKKPNDILKQMLWLLYIILYFKSINLNWV